MKMLHKEYGRFLRRFAFDETQRRVLVLLAAERLLAVGVSNMFLIGLAYATTSYGGYHDIMPQAGVIATQLDGDLSAFFLREWVLVAVCSLMFAGIGSMRRAFAAIVIGVRANEDTGATGDQRYPLALFIPLFLIILWNFWIVGRFINATGGFVPSPFGPIAVTLLILGQLMARRRVTMFVMLALGFGYIWLLLFTVLLLGEPQSVIPTLVRHLRIQYYLIALVSLAMGFVVNQIGPPRVPRRTRVNTKKRRRAPFVRRGGFVDMGVPVPDNGDPGSGSFSSVKEPGLGFVFKALRSFDLKTASVAIGVRGNVRFTTSLCRLDAKDLSRISQVLTVTQNVPGGPSFSLYDRIYGVFTQDANILRTHTWYWFDVPLESHLVPNELYELIFSDFVVTSGMAVYENNWLYSHPLFDLEDRAYGRPYEVEGLIRVTDGSMRGTRDGRRWAQVPMALMRVGTS